LDWDEYQALLQRHRGKIVVVDCWSTSCDPCLKEFPGLVALASKFKYEVACVSLSLDYEGGDTRPEDVRERVLKFLTEQGATFDNVISRLDSDALLTRLQIAAPPVVLVYDRKGDLVRKFDNDRANSEAEYFTYRDVEAVVERLVSEKS
jgi:thiol-disulfide isomerase/thioredoxin